jgi:hypothetical protein
MAAWNRLEKGLVPWQEQSYGTMGSGLSKTEEDKILDVLQQQNALDDLVHPVMDREEFQGPNDPALLR